MPNWVYNSIGVGGKPEDLHAFIAKATKVRPWKDEAPDEERFSFWNFIAPPEDKLDEYFGDNGFKKDATTGESIHYGNTEYNWYNWNINNWGCKWDANDPEIESYGGKCYVIRFSTAWGMPTEIFTAMTEQHPELDFDFEWEEEQGWGGEAMGKAGVFTEGESWDIPESHADYVKRGREDSCRCGWEDDPKEWYNDCPPLTDEEIERNKELANA